MKNRRKTFTFCFLTITVLFSAFLFSTSLVLSEEKKADSNVENATQEVKKSGDERSDERIEWSERRSFRDNDQEEGRGFGPPNGERRGRRFGPPERPGPGPGFGPPGGEFGFDRGPFHRPPRSFLTPDRLEKIKEDFPDLAEAIEQTHSIFEKIKQTVHEYHDETDSAIREEKETELKEMLEKQFDYELKRQRLEIEMMEKRLKQIKGALDQREKYKEKILESRLKEALDTKPSTREDRNNESTSFPKKEE